MDICMYVCMYVCIYIYIYSQLGSNSLKQLESNPPRSSLLLRGLTVLVRACQRLHCRFAASYHLVIMIIVFIIIIIVLIHIYLQQPH